MEEIIEKKPQLNDVFTIQDYEKYYNYAINNGYTIQEIEPINTKGENDEDVQIRRYQVVEISVDSTKQKIRDERDNMINSILWRIERYNQQKQLGIETTDSESEYMAILQYIQYLRDVPEQAGFPSVELLSFEDWNKK